MTIAASVVADLLAHAREERPRECCGILLGRGDHVNLSIRARNISGDPNRFEVDPQDHINARRTARARDFEVIGFYHSHPQSAAQPSPTDLSEAAYPECVHVIVGFNGEEPEVRVYRYREGLRAEPVELRILSPKP